MTAWLSARLSSNSAWTDTHSKWALRCGDWWTHATGRCDLSNGLPAEALDHETGGNTIGTILYHVALIELDWLSSEILEEPYPDQLSPLFPAVDRDSAGILTAVRSESLDSCLERLTRVRQHVLDRLKTMTVEDFHRPRVLPQYDVSPAWVLHHLAQHEAEHRAEIGAVIAAFGRA